MPPFSRALRDFDLEFMVSDGQITTKQAEAQILRRNMEDMKKEPLYLSILILALITLGYNFRLPLDILCGLAVYPLLKSVFSTWIKLAEIETDITYLEAGLELIRV